jgi:hypothetical protein
VAAVMDDGREDLSAFAMATIVALSLLLPFASCLRQSELVFHQYRSAAIVSCFAAV